MVGTNLGSKKHVFTDWCRWHLHRTYLWLCCTPRVGCLWSKRRPRHIRNSESSITMASLAEQHGLPGRWILVRPQGQFRNTLHLQNLCISWYQPVVTYWRCYLRALRAPLELLFRALLELSGTVLCLVALLVASCACNQRHLATWWIHCATNPQRNRMSAILRRNEKFSVWAFFLTWNLTSQALLKALSKFTKSNSVTKALIADLDGRRGIS